MINWIMERLGYVPACELKEAKTKHLAQLIVLRDMASNHAPLIGTMSSYINEMMTVKLENKEPIDPPQE